MSFTLEVDRKAFIKHLEKFVASNEKAGANVIPVIKGNGYGFTRPLLCKVAQEQKFSRIAVGTVFEATDALRDFAGDIVVLEPISSLDIHAAQHWREVLKHNRDRVIVTVSNHYIDGLEQFNIGRIIIEGKTSVHRFGFTRDDMITHIQQVQSLGTIVGFSIHSPINEPINNQVALLEAAPDSRKANSRVQEVIAWALTCEQLAEQFNIPFELSVSHLSHKDVEHITHAVPAMKLTLRSGSGLWLGADNALRVTGTVLEIQELGSSAHTHVGYRQVDSHGHKRLLIISGGTSHGVALAAPSARGSLRRRGIDLAEGVFNALGKVRSPFVLDGKNLPFAEPPHMQVSLVWTDNMTVKVGDQISCTVRNTTAHFDAVIGLSN